MFNISEALNSSLIVKISVKMSNLSTFDHYDEPHLSLNNSFLNVEECLQRINEETTSNTMVYVMILLLLLCIGSQFLYSCYLHKLFKKSQIRYNSLILNTRGVYNQTNDKHVEEIIV
jgi:hypothetical protein